MLADNFATLPDLLASRTSDCGEHCVDRWASRMPTVERAVGRPAEHDEHGLRVFIVNNMRLRGFLVPQQLRALRRLRPPRGWPDTTEAHIGARDPLARRVCKLVHARAVEMYLFGNLSVVCRARDTFVLQGNPSRHGTGRAHRDCPDSSSHHQYQFIAVLQGEMTICIERRVIGAPRDECRRRVTPVTIPTNHVLFFFGSRYAHAAACDEKCKRVAGWVSAAKYETTESSGGDIDS